MSKVAVYTGTRNVYQDMITSAKSLIANSNVETVYFLTEDDKFPYEVPDIIKTLNLSGQTYFTKDGPNYTTPYSYMCLLRVAFCYIFPDLDTLLSLDIDVICDQSVSDIWNYVDKDCYFTAAMETHRSHNGLLYTNAGVTVFNLEKLRDGKADELIEVLNTRKYTWIDQDILNYLCQGHIAELPSCYNVNDWTKPTQDKKIVHYAGYKNWDSFPLWRRYKQMSWGEVMKRHEMN